MAHGSIARRKFIQLSAAAAAASPLGAVLAPSLEVLAGPPSGSAPTTSSGDATVSAGAQAVAIGGEAQLFLDDYLVERTDDLEHRLHQPRKFGLVKHVDGSDWDRGDVYHGNIVCRDRAGRFHMTYRYTWMDPKVRDLHPSIGVDRAHWYRESIGYAQSDDGIHWRKPALGLVEAPTGFRKLKDFPLEEPTGLSRANNLGCPLDYAYDLEAYGNVHEPGKRFLLRVARRYDTHPFAGVIESRMYYAPDWPDFAGDPNWLDKLTAIPKANLSPRGFRTVYGYDHDARQWFATSQDSLDHWVPRGGRDVARYSSPDLVNWDGPELVLPVAEDEPRDKKDWIEYMDLSGYRIGGEKTGAWLGHLIIFHSDRSNPQYMMPGRVDEIWRKGTTELRLVLSRDAGKSWHRVGGKQVWLPGHPEEHGYDHLVFTTPPVRVRDELWFYYSAWDGDHLTYNRDGSLYRPGFLRTGRVALAKLRADGYMSWDAHEHTGRLLTRPLVLDGNRLTVNLAAPRGRLRAEVQNMAGKPLSGFAMADSLPMTGDGVSLPVRWRNGELRQLAGRPVRLHFELDRGSLYAFRATS